MRNITVTIEDQTYREIRAWCAQRDTCVSHVVHTFLKVLPRLQHVHRFPTPEAPDSRSLGSHFNDLYAEEAESIRRMLAGSLGKKL